MDIDEAEGRESYIERRLVVLQAMLEEAVRRHLAARPGDELEKELAPVLAELDYWRQELAAFDRGRA